MRDARFVAEHRGGPLSLDEHRLLMSWACECARHVLRLYGAKVDSRLRDALRVAADWKRGRASVGEARAASVSAIAAAHEASVQSAIAVARSVGHAVATAHMADHCLGAALYALKAVKSAGRAAEAERRWQDDRLPSAIKDLVLAARAARNLQPGRSAGGNVGQCRPLHIAAPRVLPSCLHVNLHGHAGSMRKDG